MTLVAVLYMVIIGPCLAYLRPPAWLSRFLWCRVDAFFKVGRCRLTL
jgi:hypothetical protein